MRVTVSLLACAVCIAYLLAPTNTKADDYPNTPLVSVLEIGPTSNWVTVQACCIGEKFRIGGENTQFWTQANVLGNYTCSLYGKRGVLLSQLTDGTVANLRVYFLVACAIP